MRTRLLVILACVLSGCHDTRLLGLPPTPAGAMNVLLVIESKGQVVATRVRDVRSTEPLIIPNLSTDDELWALYYDETLFRLGVPVGTSSAVTPANAGETSSVLPPPDATFEAALETDEWREVNEGPDAAIRTFKYPSLDWTACAMRGGCSHFPYNPSRSSTVTAVCQNPCPTPKEPEPPDPPAPPELPRIVPAAGCARGFQAVATSSVDPVMACDIVDLVADVCSGTASAQLLGDGGCRSIGDPCPTGEWSDMVPPNAIYVRPGAMGGTGTSMQPYGTIAEAMSAAPPGAVIALGSGVYDEPVRLASGVTLHGSCAERCLLRATGAAAVVTAAQNGSLIDLRIEPGASHGVDVVGSSAQLDLSGVAVVGSSSVGIEARDGGRVRIADSLLRDDIIAVSLVRRARADIMHSALERGLGAQIVAVSSTVTVQDSIVRGFRPDAVDAGSGLVLRGSTARVDRTLLFRNANTGVYAEASSWVHIADSAIRETKDLPQAEPSGSGVAIANSKLEMDRTYIARNRAVGIRTDVCQVSLNDVHITITTTAPDPMRTQGYNGGDGLVLNGSSMVGRRIVVELSWRSGVSLNWEVFATTASISDLVVRGSSPHDLSEGGDGLLVTGSSLVLTRARLQKNRGTAMSFNGWDATFCPGFPWPSPSTATVTDIVARDTLPRTSDGSGGFSMFSYCGGHVSIDRALFEGNGVGVHGTVDGKGSRPVPILKLSNVTDRNNNGDSFFVDSGQLIVSRAVIEHPGERGLNAAGGATAIFSDVRISGARGAGVQVRDRATIVDVSRFVCDAEAGFGVQLLATNVDVELHDGRISSCPTGIDILAPGYPIEDLIDGVVFENDPTNIAQPQ
jgi:hypothetical protein